MGTGTIVHDRGARVERNANAQAQTASRTGKIARASLVSEAQARAAAEANRIMNTSLKSPRRVRYTEEDPELPRSVRRSKRLSHEHRVNNTGKTLLSIGLGLLGALIAAMGISSGVSWYLAHIADPLAYGQWHGNHVEFRMNNQTVSVYSLNNHGNILLFEVLPNGTTKPIAMPRVYSSNPDAIVVEVNVIDQNLDGIPDLAVHISTPDVDFPSFARHTVGDLVLYGTKDGSFTPNRPTSK